MLPANDSILMLSPLWPIVAMFFLVFYRRQICGLITRTRHVKIMWFEGDFDPPDEPSMDSRPLDDVRENQRN